MEALKLMLNLTIHGILVAWMLGAGAAVVLAVTGRRQQVRELLRRYSMAAAILSLAALMVLVEDGFRVVNASVNPPSIYLPPKGWLDQNYPLRLGGWHGKTQELDEKIVRATESEDSVSRAYQDGMGHTISVHLALFRSPRTGVYHTPMNCYRSSGWSLKNKALLPLQAKDGSDTPDIEVCLTTWENDKKERKLVLFWYEVGEHVLYERGDLPGTHWKLRGRESWPPTFKVLMDVSVTDQAKDQTRLLEFAQYTREWLHAVQASLPAASPEAD